MVVTMNIDEVLRQNASGKDLLYVKVDSEAIVRQSIVFQSSSCPFTTLTKNLLTKYVVLTQPSESNTNSAGSRSQSQTPSPSDQLPSNTNKEQSGNEYCSAAFTVFRNDGIPEPKFYVDKKPVLLEWSKSFVKTRSSIGAGLVNYGNTCFLNSVLQVLTHTAPLVRYAVEQHSTSECHAVSQGFCAICSLQAHVDRAFKPPAYGNFSNPILPKWVLSKMRVHIMKSYISGRQEDAHEFLRFFVESMEASRLYDYKRQKLDRFTKETNIISRIFGGFTRNTITCGLCREKSCTFDPFLDLSLDLNGRLNGSSFSSSPATGRPVSSVEDALTVFTKFERLTGSNSYRCTKCKRFVNAFKRMQIHRAPAILTIHLKRFDHSGKIGRPISYKERLELTPYMSQETGSEKAIYQLYGVIIHTGNTTHSGHYYAYIRSLDGQWHIADDSRVQPVSDHQARSAQAYMLFYQRSSTPKAEVRPQTRNTILEQKHSLSTAAMCGPQLVSIIQASDRPTHTVSPMTNREIHAKPISTIERLKSQAKSVEMDTVNKKALVPYDYDDDEDWEECLSNSQDSTVKQEEQSSQLVNIFESLKAEQLALERPATSTVIDSNDQQRPPIKIKIKLKTDSMAAEENAGNEWNEGNEGNEKAERKRRRKERRRRKRHTVAVRSLKAHNTLQPRSTENTSCSDGWNLASEILHHSVECLQLIKSKRHKKNRYELAERWLKRHRSSPNRRYRGCLHRKSHSHYSR